MFPPGQDGSDEPASEDESSWSDSNDGFRGDVPCQRYAYALAKGSPVLYALLPLVPRVRSVLTTPGFAIRVN